MPRRGRHAACDVLALFTLNPQPGSREQTGSGTRLLACSLLALLPPVNLGLLEVPPPLKQRHWLATKGHALSPLRTFHVKSTALTLGPELTVAPSSKL